MEIWVTTTGHYYTFWSILDEVKVIFVVITFKAARSPRWYLWTGAVVGCVSHRCSSAEMLCAVHVFCFVYCVTTVCCVKAGRSAAQRGKPPWQKALALRSDGWLIPVLTECTVELFLQLIGWSSHLLLSVFDLSKVFFCIQKFTFLCIFFSCKNTKQKTNMM